MRHLRIHFGVSQASSHAWTGIRLNVELLGTGRVKLMLMLQRRMKCLRLPQYLRPVGYKVLKNRGPKSLCLPQYLDLVATWFRKDKATVRSSCKYKIRYRVPIQSRSVESSNYIFVGHGISDRSSIVSHALGQRRTLQTKAPN